jgi:alpha-1,3-rhamnosyl/mannosyltransferase
MLYVGTMEPRKNLLQIVRAMSLFPDNLRKHLPLVCVGWRGWKNEELMVEINRLELATDFFFLGRVDDNNLAKLYSGARVFLYPSVYEGFGLPILEAMACGCPVICSNQASLPEVAGDAAVLVAPEDHELLAHKIENTIENKDFRQHLVETGYQQITKFSWEKAAGKTMAVFRQLMNA